MTRIFIIDDHPIMRQVLRSVLEWEGDLMVCGEAATAEAALETVARSRPDLVLIDVSLPGMSGLELVDVLRKQYPDLPLALLSGHGEKSHVERALNAGVRGYILKGQGDELPDAIRQMMQGQQYLSPSLPV